MNERIHDGILDDAAQQRPDALFHDIEVNLPGGNVSNIYVLEELFDSLDLIDDEPPGMHDVVVTALHFFGKTRNRVHRRLELRADGARCLVHGQGQIKTVGPRGLLLTTCQTIPLAEGVQLVREVAPGFGTFSEDVFPTLLKPEGVNREVDLSRNRDSDQLVHRIGDDPVWAGVQYTLQLSKTQHQRLFSGVNGAKARSQEGNDQHDHDHLQDNEADPQRIRQGFSGRIQPVRRRCERLRRFYVLVFMFVFVSHIRPTNLFKRKW